MTDYREQLAGAVQATVIHSPTSFSWFGKYSPPLAPRLARAFTPTSTRTLLLFDLQNELYTNFYCRGGAAASADEDIFVPEVETSDFVAELAAANPGKGYWQDPDWKVRLVEEDRVLVRRGALELWARPADCLNGRAPLARGAGVSLRRPREARQISPGFYSVLGKTPWPYRSGPLVRWYWNLTVGGARRFLSTATTVLDRAAVAFRLKVANHPRRFTRCDAGVLYLRYQDCEPGFELLVKIFAEVGPFLKQGTPALTRPVAPGLGWAEDPGVSDGTIYWNSFGTHRCHLLADGMIRAYETEKTSLEERLRVVESRFREEGISLEEPFRNFRRGRRCRLDHLAAQLASCRTAKMARLRQPTGSLLETAQEIGNRITREAIWHAGSCNWLGAAPPTLNVEPASGDGIHRPLGPDLYSGTAGVALFLAELYQEGGRTLRHTVTGTIRHSLSCAGAIREDERLALYTGWTGIAIAAARVGVISGQGELLEQSDKLVRRALRYERVLKGSDLLSGKAGSIVGLLWLRRVLNRPLLLDAACSLGDTLLEDAAWDGGACSWKSRGTMPSQNLTGFAHGAAGTAYALLELFQETGNVRYRTTAEGAFEYERRCFDAEARNWPDFRVRSERPRTLNRRVLSFANTWSNGAPGIALSRLRAFEVLGDETYRLEVMSALETICQPLRDWRNSNIGNWSLSEGLAGNCEVLLHASEVLGYDIDEGRSLIREVVQEATRNHAQRGHHWPCATKGGETPSLMLGLAGVGYLCLCMSKPQTPSLLAFGTTLTRGLD